MMTRRNKANDGRNVVPSRNGFTGDTPSLEQRHRPTKDKQYRERRVRHLSLEDLDKRTLSARAAFAFERSIQEDLGGKENLSTAELALARRSAVLSAIIEHEEARWCAGEKIDLPQLCSAINCLRRVLESIGLERRPARTYRNTVGGS